MAWVGKKRKKTRDMHGGFGRERRGSGGRVGGGETIEEVRKQSWPCEDLAVVSVHCGGRLAQACRQRQAGDRGQTHHCVSRRKGEGGVEEEGAVSFSPTSHPSLIVALYQQRDVVDPGPLAGVPHGPDSGGDGGETPGTRQVRDKRPASVARGRRKGKVFSWPRPTEQRDLQPRR